MSLSLEALTPICVQDPRMINEPRIYPVLKCAEDVLYKQFSTVSISQASINFSCPPPSQEIYIDRRVSLLVPVRVTLRAEGLNAGQLLINPQQFCLRSYPIQKSLDTIQMTINNQSMSVNMADMVSALEHFNIDRREKNNSFSTCPTYPASQSQQFSDLFCCSRSPMALYTDGIDGIPPQQFPYTIVSQTNVGGVATSVVDFVSCEQLMLSPLYWGNFDQDDSGFFGVKTMDFTFNFQNGAGNRMVAIDAVSNGVPLPITPGTWSSNIQFSNFMPAFSYPDNQPLLLFQYLTPNINMKSMGMSKVMNYPFFNVERYPTDLNAINAGATSTASSNNIQLNSIPSKIYIFLRKKNADLLADPFSPDTFLAINNISVQWFNKNGVLSSANQRQLYQLAVKNGCTLSYASWSGLKLNKGVTALNGFGTPAEQYSGCGSVLSIDPLDLGLDALSAPGKLAQLMMQVTVNYTNVSDNAIYPTLYIVTVSNGIFSIFNGQSSTLVGVLTSDDIVNCHRQTQHELITYADVRRINGGNFLTNVKDRLVHIYKKIKPYVEKGYEIAKIAAPLVKLAMSAAGEEGGVRARGVRARGVRAGAKIPRSRLRKRLQK